MGEKLAIISDIKHTIVARKNLEICELQPDPFE